MFTLVTISDIPNFSHALANVSFNRLDVKYTTFFSKNNRLFTYCSLGIDFHGERMGTAVTITTGFTPATEIKQITFSLLEHSYILLLT